MRFEPTSLPGVFVVELEKHEDERGFFARSYCEAEFREHGLADRFVQANVSYNRRRKTLWTCEPTHRAIAAGWELS